MKVRQPLPKAVLSVLAIICLAGCADDPDTIPYSETGLDAELNDAFLALDIDKRNLILPKSNDFTKQPQDPLNPISTEKVKLGQFLFHETGLAKNPMNPIGMDTYSCASCHHFAAGFQSGQRQGMADGGIGFGLFGEARELHPDYEPDMADRQPIKQPPTVNLGYQKIVLWNGKLGATGPNEETKHLWDADNGAKNNHLGYEGVEIQGIAGTDMHRLVINEDLINELGYRTLFNQAFPNIPKTERYSVEYAALAIASYERTIIANQAPFQLWLKGDNEAMTDDQKNGAILFFGKGKCYECHNGPALNTMSFHALGFNDLEGDGVHAKMDDTTRKGRGGFTQNPKDDYTFKTPQLYNLTEAKFYGHGSSFNSIRDVIQYKNDAIPQNESVPESALSAKFRPLLLTELEIDLLDEFVSKALNDPNLKRYVPVSLPSGNCFPNADSQSREDMGCD
jgi:cytochrome c peroxidase